ncbi:glycosyltransferase [Cellulomonas sp. ATA003]|uniref:glycosyltransferase n=1 Tax=Cellulomonas sp. ATA003 TaxID=3073064 RepID=UPI0028738C91|nr:glycosyltransferase [Cellulomonas sp. ATA003]WNB86338.1 glycosyltransferase [Cellulomonas sp. ATA003]
MTDSLAPVTGQIPLRRGPRVTAVVVTRGPTRYLGTTLRALADQSRPPDAVLVVDAKAPSTDDSAVDPARVDDLVQATLGGADAQPRTVPAPGARTFGDAVRTALGAPAASPATAPATGTATGTPVDADDAAAAWLWLLHDDSAPAPDALAELVRVIEHAPSVAVAGVKQRGWYTPDRLLEVGLTTSRLGRRVTGVEDGEVDQGQHDGREDVLAVGLAGALVRHDVWDELGDRTRRSARSVTGWTCAAVPAWPGTAWSWSRVPWSGTRGRRTPACATTTCCTSSPERPSTTPIRTSRPTPPADRRRTTTAGRSRPDGGRTCTRSSPRCRCRCCPCSRSSSSSLRPCGRCTASPRRTPSSRPPSSRPRSSRC